MRLVHLAAIVALAVASNASARGGGHAVGHSRSYVPQSAYSTRVYAGVTRDAHGKIARSPHAKEAFRRVHPCPATGKTYGACPGWVVDHVQALKHGGADDPSNMQWQRQSAARAKDKWE